MQLQTASSQHVASPDVIMSDENVESGHCFS